MTTLPNPPLWLILIAFVCALGPLVFFHELGHYLVARFFRIPAEIFSIGFGRELIGWTDKQGTRWKVAWLPLGGYVKFVGDMSSASEPVDVESIAPEMRDRAFQLRPVWQRFLVVLAGPVANFLLATIIFAAIFMSVGGPSTNVVGKVFPDSAAAGAGLQPGDRIVAVAGKETKNFNMIQAAVVGHPNEIVTLRLQRGDQFREIDVRLHADELQDEHGKQFRRGLLGVSPAPLPGSGGARSLPRNVDHHAFDRRGPSADVSRPDFDERAGWPDQDRAVCRPRGFARLPAVRSASGTAFN
jgi:regulator of sigma E protease